MDTEPCDQLDLSDVEIELCRGQMMEVSGQKVPCDRMKLRKKYTGKEDGLAIYRNKNGRRVVRVRQTMQLQGGAPPSPVLTDFGLSAESVAAEEERELLKIYDQCPKRTFPS